MMVSIQIRHTLTVECQRDKHEECPLVKESLRTQNDVGRMTSLVCMCGCHLAGDNDGCT